MCVLIFSTNLSTTFLIQRSIHGDCIIHVCRYSCQVPIILVRFKSNLNFLSKFSKNTPASNFLKIHPVGAKLFHVARRLDKHEIVNSHFPQFCECA